jgi:NAD(P)-dependent dehydrogenase (short-subunit alcohol dehydrogenase family)
MAMRLERKNVLVVGAGTRKAEPGDPVGNGRAIAVVAAREGATVACLDRVPEAAQETVTLIESDGGKGFAVAGDVTDEADTRRAIDEVISRMGYLDGVVFNVGIAIGNGLMSTNLEQWDTTFALNARSHFLITQLVEPHLVEGASLVYISSSAAARAFSLMPSYDASKGAVEGLTRHVALELGPRAIRANSVRIGVIDSPIGRQASQNRPARDVMTIPLGNRKGTPWEIATTVLFFLSDDSSYVSGQTLAVDGALIESR